MNKELDWPRIAHLMKIGVAAALMVLAGDMLLGWGMAKWKTAGDLIACEHCRNAFEEMEMLDEGFERVLARKPEFPMPSWRELKAQMPGWDAIRKQYIKKENGLLVSVKK